MFTCNTCSLQFPTPDDQRSHMKSEWHRYNLKRRVANLPAIEETLFNEKVAKLSINEDGEDTREEKKKNEKQITKKEQRRKQKEELLEKKRQLLEIAKQNMINSLKTDGQISVKQNVNQEEEKELNEVSDEKLEEKLQEQQGQQEEELKQTSEEQPTENQIQDDQLTDDQLLAEIMEEKLKNKVEIPPEVCLFCNKSFEDLDSCTTHMFKFHGFYIPEQTYLVDKPGLVKYMAEKIGVGNLCVVCDYQGRSLHAVRAHMLAKQHCRIPYESEVEKLEISEFYDFTSTYDFLKKDNEDDDEDWEDLEGDEEVVDVDNSEDDGDEAEQEDLPQHVSYDDGVELHLPSGVKVGHRSLARYYRQNLRPESVLSEGQGTVIAAESRHLVNVADRAALMEKKRTWRTEKSHLDRDDRRAAKFINNQPHYRDQLLQ